MNGLGQPTIDMEIWEAIRRGDEAAFRTLYDRYWPKVYASAYSYLRDGDVCEEIVHDIFLDIWLRRARLEIVSFPHYLTAAARYQVYKRLQQKGVLKIIYKDPPGESASQVTHNQGEYDLTYRELQSSVEASLQHLPGRCREIFLLSRKEQLSIPEIAERLAISRRTVENQLTRALQHLRHSLGDLYITFLLLGCLNILFTCSR